MIRQSFEKLLFASRWLLAPFYLALVVALLALLAKVGVHVYDLTTHFLALSEDQVLLSALGVVDLTLSASLIVIVILSGYVNFIAPVDIDDAQGLAALVRQHRFQRAQAEADGLDRRHHRDQAARSAT